MYLDKTILRPASEEDFPAIRALIRIVGINPTGLDWHRFVVAVTPDDEMIGCGQVNQDAAGVFISLRLPSMDPGQAKRDEHRYSYSPILTQHFPSRKIVLLRAFYVIAQETEWMRQRPLPR